MYCSESANHQLGSSQAHSLSGFNLSARKSMAQHSLPHVTQPILSKYRSPRPSNELVIEENASFWCSLFSKSPVQGLSLCKCERTEEGHCEMVMRWVEEFYDWRNDSKFVKAYQNYTRRNIELFLSESEIVSRLEKKLQILGVRLGERYEAMLVRISKNYLKHTIYYGKSELLTRENDLWMWFLIGIFYHMGSSLTEPKEKRHEEEIIFWSLDIVMNSFENLTRAVLNHHIQRMVELTKEYFPKWHATIVHQYHIDLEPIVYEWTHELMMGYMGIESIAFYIDCLLKKGWTYVYQVTLSYLQKRLERMEHDEIFETVRDKEAITREIINCQEEWPLIFCNAATFRLEKEESHRKPL